MPMTLNHWDICRPAQPICILLEYTDLSRSTLLAGWRQEDKQSNAIIRYITRMFKCFKNIHTLMDSVQRNLGLVSVMSPVLKPSTADTHYDCSFCTEQISSHSLLSPCRSLRH
uniref:Uncharacterized protein n=1 Tax=Astatotilapia calliptera TaxID=8154 RepID=A0AAX7VDV6_ASTCA